MKKPNGMLIEIVALLMFSAVGLILFKGFDRGSTAHAATTSFAAWERELGAQKLTPTTAAALTLPTGTLHAEIYIEGGPVFVRWNGGTPVDSATGAMKWPEGHFRKEENDGQKLSGLRLLCADCTVWVNYFGRR